MPEGYDVVMDLGEAADPLQFQDFHLNDSSGQTPSAPPPAYSSGAGLGIDPASINAAGSEGGIFSLGYYRGYFDVDTDQVLERIKQSFLPTGTFLDLINAQGGDLWGPFWIPTTLALLSFMTSSLATWFTDFMASKPFAYDYNTLSTAFSLIYIYVGLGSLALWATMKYLGCMVTWMEIIGLYGYSMAVWVPVMVAAIVPMDLVRWVCLISAAAFLGYNFYQIFNRTPTIPHAKPVLAVAGFAHAMFALLIKAELFSPS